MQLIEIDNKKYRLHNDLSQYNIFKYLEFFDILNEREKVKKKQHGELVDGEILYDIVPVNEESESFKRLKSEKLLKFLIPDIPQWVLELKNKRFNQFFISIEKTMKTEVKFVEIKELLDGEWFKLMDKYETELYCPKYDELTFQEYADIDNKMCRDNLPLILAILLRPSKVSYDRYHKKMSYADKIDFLKDLPVSKTYNLLAYYIDFLKSVKEQYTYLWGNHDVPSATKTVHYDKFSELVGWENTIAILAENGVFGNIHSVRKEPYYEVLDYLNIKRGRDISETRDYHANQKKQKSN